MKYITVFAFSPTGDNKVTHLPLSVLVLCFIMPLFHPCHQGSSWLVPSPWTPLQNPIDPTKLTQEQTTLHMESELVKFLAFCLYNFSVALLSDGRIVEHGRVNDLLSNDESEFRKLVTKAGLISEGEGQII